MCLFLIFVLGSEYISFGKFLQQGNFLYNAYNTSNLSLHSLKQRNGQCWISILKFILSKVLCFTDLNIRGEIYIYTEV